MVAVAAPATPEELPMNLMHRTLLAGVGLVALAACGAEPARDKSRSTDPSGTQAAIPAPAKKETVKGLPGMPPVLDPKDVYAADRPDKLSPVVKDFPSRVYVPNSESEHRLRHRPEDVQDHRDHPRRPPAPARRPVLGPEDPLGQQQPRPHPHPHRPEDRQGGQGGRGPRPLQPLLHTPRQVRRRHGLPRPRTRLPRPAHHEADQDRAGHLLRRQPRRLLPRRPVLHRLLRVQRRAAEGRHRSR